MRMGEQNVVNVSRDYAIGGIVRHVGRGDNINYVVRRYGYTLDDDTVEPPADIPKRLITRCWRRV